jgi:hypothetical protein
VVRTSHSRDREISVVGVNSHSVALYTEYILREGVTCSVVATPSDEMASSCDAE